MSIFHQGLSFLHHRLTAGTAHGLHSPFFFQLYGEVVANPTRLAAWNQPEANRNRLLGDNRHIRILDFGAGSRVSPAQSRPIRKIAASGLMPAYWAERLDLLARFIKADTILELGTSFGITTQYLAQPGRQVTTIEACTETLALARTLWNSEVAARTTSLEGRMENVLPALAGQKFDLVVLDANHTFEGVQAAIASLLPLLHAQSVLVVDDIYWSAGMTQAWRWLQQHPQVRQSLDLYRQGWLFFRENQAQEHFVRRPLRYF